MPRVRMHACRKDRARTYLVSCLLQTSDFTVPKPKEKGTEGPQLPKRDSFLRTWKREGLYARLGVSGVNSKWLALLTGRYLLRSSAWRIFPVLSQGQAMLYTAGGEPVNCGPNAWLFVLRDNTIFATDKKTDPPR